MMLKFKSNPLVLKYSLVVYSGELNDKKIQVSDKSDLLTSCLVTGFPYQYLDTANGPLQIFEKLIRKAIPVRRLGSAALDLCWTAAGRFDGFYEHKLQAWDSAAGFLIVEEAGGKVTDLQGNKYTPYNPGIIATNGNNTIFSFNVKSVTFLVASVTSPNMLFW